MGPLWIWNIAEDQFPEATQIVERYHAKEYLSDLAGRAQALGPELWIAHTLEVALEIMETATSQIGARNLALNAIRGAS